MICVWFSQTPGFFFYNIEWFRQELFIIQSLQIMTLNLSLFVWMWVFAYTYLFRIRTFACTWAHCANVLDMYCACGCDVGCDRKHLENIPVLLIWYQMSQRNMASIHPFKPVFILKLFFGNVNKPQCMNCKLKKKFFVFSFIQLIYNRLEESSHYHLINLNQSCPKWSPLFKKKKEKTRINVCCFRNPHMAGRDKTLSYLRELGIISQLSNTIWYSRSLPFAPGPPLSLSFGPPTIKSLVTLDLKDALHFHNPVLSCRLPIVIALSFHLTENKRDCP